MEVPGKPGPENFSRLQREHAKALQATQETIKTWEKFKYDYDVLQARLHTLPDKLTHDVMVPFGRFGFMQGQLYHTNEVMVLLGDNWFAQRTAKQAIEIAERRKKYVCEMLDKERKVMEDFQTRSGFVQELSAATERDGFEIREEYDPIEEEKRKKAKREERERRRRGGVKVPPPRPAFPKTHGAGEGKGGGGGGGGGGRGLGDDSRREELWAKLEQQEKEEEEEEKGERKGEGKKTVLGEDKVAGEKQDDERKEKKAVLGEVDERGREVKSSPTISFKHTEATTHTDTPQTEEVGWEGGRTVFSTPGDICSRPRRSSHSAAEEEGERREVHWDPHLVSYSKESREETISQHTTSDTSATCTHQPFSGVVVETQARQLTHPQSSSRKMSKFKSSRSRQSNQ